MSLLQEIQNNLNEAEEMRKLEIEQLVAMFEEMSKNPKPSLGIVNEIGRGEFNAARDLAVGAGYDYTPGGVAPSSPQAALQKKRMPPAFLMGSLVPADNIQFSDDMKSAVVVNPKTGRRSRFSVEDHGDKVVLR